MVKMKPMHADKKEVLESVSCHKAAQLLGLKTKSFGSQTFVECPFHEKLLGRPDRHLGNCKISPNGKRCYCFACKGSGNAVDMVMAYEGLSFCDSVDWLASMEAPKLLSEEWKGKTGDRCPFRKKDFEVIGIHTDAVVIPVNMAASKYEARKRDCSYTDILYADEFEIGNTQYEGVYLCIRDRISITEIWKENRALFFSIVEPKAILAFEKFRETFTELNSYMNDDALKKEINRYDEYSCPTGFFRKFTYFPKPYSESVDISWLCTITFLYTGLCGRTSYEIDISEKWKLVIWSTETDLFLLDYPSSDLWHIVKPLPLQRCEAGFIMGHQSDTLI